MPMNPGPMNWGQFSRPPAASIGGRVAPVAPGSTGGSLDRMMTGGIKAGPPRGDPRQALDAYQRQMAQGAQPPAAPPSGRWTPKPGSFDDPSQPAFRGAPQQQPPPPQANWQQQLAEQYQGQPSFNPDGMRAAIEAYSSARSQPPQMSAGRLEGRRQTGLDLPEAPSGMTDPGMSWNPAPAPPQPFRQMQRAPLMGRRGY